LKTSQIYVDQTGETLNWSPNNLAIFSDWVVKKQQAGIIRDDVAAVHLLSGPSPSGQCDGIGGLAYVKTLCKSYYQTAVSMVTNYNSLCPYNPFPVIAHELGHNFGMPHLWENRGPSKGSTGYIMDYGDQSLKLFHPNSANSALQSLPGFQCLRTSGVTTNPSEPRCGDGNANCGVWARAGECAQNPGYMLVSCKASCNMCGEDFTDRGKFGGTTSNCVAFSEWPSIKGGVTCSSCSALVATDRFGGRCDRYCESFGHKCLAAAEEQADNCQIKFSASCSQEITGTSDMLCTCEKDDTAGQSSGSCQDDNGQCSRWARDGECTRNPKYMLANCKLSCNACSTSGSGSTSSSCRDSNTQCTSWASNGECANNPRYMLANCKKSCNVCN